GTKIVSNRFLLHGKAALHWRLLALSLIWGVPLAIGVFVLVRFRAFWREGWAAVARPWGRVLAVSVALATATELFEKPLGHVPGVPKFFLEELFELVAAIGFVVAAVARASSRDPSPARAIDKDDNPRDRSCGRDTSNAAQVAVS